MQFKILFFISIFISLSSEADQGVRACFNDHGSGSPYLELMGQADLPPFDALTSVVTSCREVSSLTKEGLDLNKKHPYLVEKIANIGEWLIFGLFGRAKSAFSKFDFTQMQKDYMKSLEKIKQNPERHERIRDVYLLAARYQGIYDYGSLAGFSLKHLSLSPESPLDKGGGVCRNFASLLAWSLLQVARPTGNKNMALDETSFSSDIVTGPGFRGGGHAWVRIKLPKKREKMPGYDFEEVDLDTTNYPNSFVALSPRHSGMPFKKLEETYRKCREVVSCLVENLNKKGLGKENPTESLRSRSAN